MAGYIALVHKDEGTSYGVSFPDVRGCISAGDTFEEAIANAAEALAEPAESMGIVKNRISLVGNINNPETLYSKGPEEVRREVYQNLEAGVQLVGPECAIPLQTRIDNLKEIPKAIKDWHQEHTTQN